MLPAFGLTSAGKSVLAGTMVAALGGVGFFNQAKRRAAAKIRRQGVSDDELDIDALILFPDRRQKLLKKIACAYMPWVKKCKKGRKRQPFAAGLAPRRRSNTAQNTAKRLLRKPMEMFHKMKCSVMPSSSACRKRRHLKRRRRRY